MNQQPPNRPIRLIFGLLTLALPLMMVLASQLYSPIAQAASAIAPSAGELTLSSAAAQTANVTNGAANITYAHTLVNTTAITYTVQFTTTSSQGYSTSTTPASGAAGTLVLGANSSEAVTLVVSVPAGATHGAVDTATLTVGVVSTPTINVSVSDTTTVVNGTIDVGVTADDADQTASPGGSVTYNYTIENTGTITETFDITRSDAQSGWSSTVTPSSVTLAPGATAAVAVAVSVPSSATNAQTNITTVKATSSVDSTVTDQSTNVTTVVNIPPTPSNTPDTNIYADSLEPNDSFSNPTLLVANAAATCNLTFWPIGDKDYFYFNTAVGEDYTILADIQTTGIDTYLTAFDPSGDVITTNDDGEDMGRSSELTFRAGTANTHFVSVVNLDGSDPANKTYCISLKSVTPTETPTPTITPTPSETPEPSNTPEPTATATVPGDGCEPNNEFGRACLIETNKKYSSIDFLNPYGNGPDKDWYRVWVKRGLTYTCLTEDLSGFNDTNMTLFDKNNRWLGSNDDRSVGDLGSEVTYRTTYDGYLYVLIEPYNTPDRDKGAEFTYSLTCRSIAPTETPEPTATPEPTDTPEATNTPAATNTPSATNTPAATNTPDPTNTPAATNTAAPTPTKAPTKTPAPTNTPAPTRTPTRRPATGSGTGGTVRTNTPVPTEIPTETPTLEPTATLVPTETPTPRPVVNISTLPTATPEIVVPASTTLDVILYYDENDNQQPEINEGIVDMVVVVYDNTTGNLLSFGYTNEGGAVRFRELPVSGPVRISVPYLGFSQVVTGSSTVVQLRIPPQQLPGGIP